MNEIVYSIYETLFTKASDISHKIVFAICISYEIFKRERERESESAVSLVIALLKIRLAIYNYYWSDLSSLTIIIIYITTTKITLKFVRFGTLTKHT